LAAIQAANHRVITHMMETPSIPLNGEQIPRETRIDSERRRLENPLQAVKDSTLLTKNGPSTLPKWSKKSRAILALQPKRPSLKFAGS